MSDGRHPASDTPASVRALVSSRCREMSPHERFDLIAALNDSCERMAAAGVRRRHPTAGESEVHRRVTALRLGRELMIAAYGWDPHVEGW